MKKLLKSKTFLGAVMSIALCVSLIAGATFAIFTSESNVNIAVTTGKVKVEATAQLTSLYSPKEIDRDGNVTNEDNAATADGFYNGGTATLDGNTLILDRVTPGDRVDFSITLKNIGNVKTLYRYGYAVKPLAEEGATDADVAEAEKLYSALEFELEEVETSRYVSYMTAWSEFTEEKVLDISVGMSTMANSDYMTLSGRIVFIVEAVQGNAAVGAGEQFEIADKQGFINAIDMINNSENTSAKLVMASDVELTDEVLAIAADKDVTIDLAGNDLSSKSTQGDGLTINSGATLTLANSGSMGSYTFNSTANNSDGIFVGNEEEGKTATLNIEGDVEINITKDVNSAIHACATKGNAVVNIDGATVNITGEKQMSAIVVDQNSTLNIKNATVNAHSDFDSYSDGNDVVGILLWGQNGVQKNIAVNIENGATISAGGKNAFAQGIQIGMKNGYSDNVNVVMNGGEIMLTPTENGKGYAFTAYKDVYGKFTMNGGKIGGNVTALALAYIGNVDLTVTGGTFSVDPTDYLAKEYNATEENGVWTVAKA